MIQLRKGPKPKVLIDKANDWTIEFLEAKDSVNRLTDAVRFRYRHQDIKNALRNESHDKCVYCESKLGFGETDHIHPVSRRPELVVAWENLALSCKECNTNKKDYYSLEEPLINPFVDDPSNHFIFHGPTVFEVAGDVKGMRTRRLLKLNRIDLVQKRLLTLERLASLANEWKTHHDGATKSILQQALIEEASEESEYSATIRAFVAFTLGWNPWNTNLPAET